MRVAIVRGTGDARAAGCPGVTRAATRCASSTAEARSTGSTGPRVRASTSPLRAATSRFDASNDASKRAADTLVEGTRRLLAAEAAAGVSHPVGVSIVAASECRWPHSQVKASQKRVVEQGPVPWSLVRATRFHEYIGVLFASAARWHMLPALRAPLQTVSCAEGILRRGRVTIVGPDVVEARALARRWRAISGRRTLLLPVPFPTGSGGRRAAVPSPPGQTSGARPGSHRARLTPPGRHRRSSHPLIGKENRQ